MKTIQALAIAVILLSAAGCASIWPDEKGFRNLDHPQRASQKKDESGDSEPDEKKSRWDLHSDRAREIEQNLGL